MFCYYGCASYGREEMLALFEQSLKIRPPASISNFKSLYVDQSLNPLALAPVTDDENVST